MDGFHRVDWGTVMRDLPETPPPPIFAPPREARVLTFGLLGLGGIAIALLGFLFRAQTITALGFLAGLAFLCLAALFSAADARYSVSRQREFHRLYALREKRRTLREHARRSKG